MSNGTKTTIGIFLAAGEVQELLGYSLAALCVVVIIANALSVPRYLNLVAMILTVAWLLVCAVGAWIVQWDHAFNRRTAPSVMQVMPKWVILGILMVWAFGVAKRIWALWEDKGSGINSHRNDS